MRAFEMLLALVVSIGLLNAFFPTRKRFSITQTALTIAGVAVLLTSLHLILEGYRWPMIPLYALVVALGAFGLMVVWRKPTSRRSKILMRIPAGVGMALLILAVTLSLSFPIVHLPEPTGPYAVGTSYLTFTDPSRPETLTDDPDDIRQFKGRLWYPAQPSTAADPLEYQDYQPSINVISPGGPPEFIFSHLHLLTSNAYRDAPIADAQPAYPVLVFSTGFLTLYEDYQILAEEFASQGYVVLILDTPYESQGVRQPDGSTVMYTDAHAAAFEDHTDRVFPLWEDFWDDDTSDAERNALARQMLETDTFMDTVLRIRVADIQFAIDELGRMNTGEPASPFAGKLDLSRLVIVGHSLGGAVAGQTCLVDDRFKACVNLDGFQWGDVVNGAIQQPFMLVDSEQFAGGTDYILPNLQNDTYVLTVEGTTHMNFQDVPYIMPGSKLIGLSGSISATRMIAITNDYLLAFLGKYLNGADAPLLNGPSADYPEVDFTFRAGDGIPDSGD